MSIPSIIRRLFQKEGPSPLLGFYDHAHRDWISISTGQHAFIAGVTGSDKSNFLANIILNLENPINDGTACLYGIDLKQEVELNAYGGMFERMAATTEEAIDLLDALCNEMSARNDRLVSEHRRSVTIGTSTPAIVLIIDEATQLSVESAGMKSNNVSKHEVSLRVYY